MNVIVAMTHQTAVRLAEVAYLLIIFAGVWLVAAAFPRLRLRSTRTIVAGVALAVAGVLLILATHYGQFG